MFKSGKWTEFGRYNSYETDKYGSATENPSIVAENIKERLKIQENIFSEASRFTQYKVFGNTASQNVIVGWGSTKGAILDCIESEGIDAKFVQILYLEPFPKEDLWKELIGKNLILVENNATGQLGQVLKEKIGFGIPSKNKILKYNARPFLHDELEAEIKKRLK